MAFKASVITTEMKDAVISPNNRVIVMENSDLWFSSRMHHLKTHVVQRVVVSVSLESKKKCQLLQKL